MKHVNPSFSILAAGINFEKAQLFAEAGPSGISLVVLDGDNCFKALVTYAFAAGLNEKELTARFNEICSTEKLLQLKYGKTHIFWSFAESILVPAEFMNAGQNAQMLDLVFGDAKQGIIRSDFLYKHNLHNVYRVPVSVIDVFSVHLPLGLQSHLFTAMVNRDLPAGNHLYANLYSNSLTTMLIKDGKLQVIQNFDYTDPADCVFHLLHVCKGFDVLPDDVILHLNGMIDEQSGLYDAIYKYFLHIGFDALPEGHAYYEPIKVHPPHFFSHLFALASCV
ncbi:MAG: DUF3822 family protein [Chitinophagaceae bacterium]|nr:DUF3822 family protein [Chitinophagaceae bacterium]